MGAVDVNESMVGKFRDFGEAFRQLQEEDAYENGHDPYSGGIYNCSFPKLMKEYPKYGTKKFHNWKEDLLAIAYRKDCFCVEITGAALKKMKGNRFKGRRGIKAFIFFGIAPF